jgi:hypothetical protein
MIPGRVHLASLPVGRVVSSHSFDILADQMAHQLTQVEASNRAVSRGQCRLILLHPAAAKLAAMFGVADHRLDAKIGLDHVVGHFR